MSLRPALCLCLALFVSACGSRPEFGALTPVGAEVASARQHTILVATTRARDERPGTLFNGERSGTLDFASVTVGIPPGHVSGQIEWAGDPARSDPARNFVTTASERFAGRDAFVKRLDAGLAAKPPGKRRVMVFIHGYNTLFAEGLYRFAQIVDDSGTPAVPVHFSWPSGGKVADYVYDNNSATASRDALEQTLRLIAATKVDQIDILAHSMGSWVTVESLRQIQIAGNFPTQKVGFVIFASPDIDLDVFKSQIARIGKPQRPYVVLLSRDDRALKLSSFIAGDKERLGSSTDSDELTRLGAVVIDLTDVKGSGGANHNKFAQLAAAAPELERLMKSPGLDHSNASSRERLADGAMTIISLPGQVLGAPIRILGGR